MLKYQAVKVQYIHIQNSIIHATISEQLMLTTVQLVNGTYQILTETKLGTYHNHRSEKKIFNAII